MCKLKFVGIRTLRRHMTIEHQTVNLYTKVVYYIFLNSFIKRKNDNETLYQDESVTFF